MIIIILLAASLAIILQPPWECVAHRRQMTFRLKYSFILLPPSKHEISAVPFYLNPNDTCAKYNWAQAELSDAKIDWSRYIVSLIVSGILTGIACALYIRRPVSARDPQPTKEVHSHRKGIRLPGFILLFCAGTMILGPILTAGRIVMDFKTASVAFSTYPTLRELLQTDAVIVCAILAAGIYVGFKLWSVKPSAVVSVRRFLVARLMLSGLRLLLFAGSGLPRDIVGSTMLHLAVYETTYFLIWFSYFRVSKQVKQVFQV